jgi:hypothetical protein
MKAKKIYISIMIATIVFVTGCAAKNSTVTDNNNANNSSQTTESNPVDPQEITNLMQQIQSESQVEGINASRDNDAIIADITLKSDADSNSAKALADKYANQIKDTFKTKKANINILQNGKNIATITTE